MFDNSTVKILRILYIISTPRTLLWYNSSLREVNRLWVQAYDQGTNCLKAKVWPPQLTSHTVPKLSTGITCLLTGKLVPSTTSLVIENYLLVNRRCLSINLWHNHWNWSQYKQNKVIVSAKHLICLRNNLCIPDLEWSAWHTSFFSLTIINKIHLVKWWTWLNK